MARCGQLWLERRTVVYLTLFKNKGIDDTERKWTSVPYVHIYVECMPKQIMTALTEMGLRNFNLYSCFVTRWSICELVHVSNRVSLCAVRRVVHSVARLRNT
jgi:hypothetical protein